MKKKDIIKKSILIFLLLSLCFLPFLKAEGQNENPGCATKQREGQNENPGATCSQCVLNIEGAIKQIQTEIPSLEYFNETTADDLLTRLNKISTNINENIINQCQHCSTELSNPINTLKSELNKVLSGIQNNNQLSEDTKNKASNIINNIIDKLNKLAQTVANNQPNTLAYYLTPQQLSTQSSETQSADVCARMAQEDYNECAGKGGGILHSWLCRILSGITGFYCRIMYNLIDGLGAAISYVMNLEIGAILWAINPQTYGGYSTNPGVKAVWAQVRDLVNLLLIIGMIIIAISTMLKLEKWGWKNTLWKLIVIALLVNFSLVIPGTIIDLSNFLSFYFLNLAKGNNENLGKAILEGFGFKEGTESPPILEQASQLSGENKETVISNAARQGYVGKFLLIFIGLILIGFFAILVLFATFLIMILRAIILCILLAIAPLAFIAWVFPTTANYFRKWWQYLIKWCLMPVIFGFLLYLGLNFIESFSQNPVEQAGIMASLIQLILFTMFLAVSLFVAVKQTDGLSEKIISATSNAVSLAIGGLAGFIGGVASRRILAGSGWSARAYKTVAERLEKAPKPFRNIGFKMKQIAKETIEEESEKRKKSIENKFAKFSDDEKKRYILSKVTNQAEKAFLLSQLFEKGKVGPEEYELIGYLKEVGKHPLFNKKALKEHRPDLFYQYIQDEAFKADTQKIMNAQKVSEITAQQMAIGQKIQEALLKASPEELKQMEITNLLTHLKNLGQLKPALNELIYQRKMDPETLAEIFRQMNASERKNWVESFKQALMEIKGYREDTQLQQELSRLGYLRNRFLANLFQIRSSSSSQQSPPKIIIP